MLRITTDQARYQDLIGSMDDHPSLVKKAFYRARHRTAATIRRRTGKPLKQAMGMSSQQVWRKRVYVNGRSLDDVYFWWGTNPLPVSSLKGRKTAKKGASKASNGARFRDRRYQDGFVMKNHKGRRSIFKRIREGRNGLEEQTYAIHNRTVEFIEDHIIDDLDNIFFHHFSKDLMARAENIFYDRTRYF